MERHQIEQQIRAALKKAECANGFHAHQEVMAELGHLCANHVADLLAPSPEARPTWQPIETAPKDGTIFAYGSGWMNVSRHFGGDAWYYAVHKGVAICWKPTHWMPLPDPPAASPLPAPKEQE